MNNLKIFIHDARTPMGYMHQIFLYEEMPDGKQSFVKPLDLTARSEVTQFYGLPALPTLEIRHDLWQRMWQDLSRGGPCGPSPMVQSVLDEKKVAAQLKATEAHLKDMQEIAMKFVGVATTGQIIVPRSSSPIMDDELREWKK